MSTSAARYQVDRLWLGRHEDDPVGQVQPVDQRPDPALLGRSLPTAGSADHDEACVGPIQVGERADGDIYALQRLDSPDEEQNRSGAQTDGLTGTALVAGAEEGMVDPRWHDLDA